MKTTSNTASSALLSVALRGTLSLAASTFSRRIKPLMFGCGLALFVLAPTIGVPAVQAQETIPAPVKNNDPCPSPKTAMSNTPNDMARVQEDIDRFTLCVERAQLLERLNTMVEKNISTIDSVLLAPQAMPMLPVDGGMTPLAPPSMPGGATGQGVSPINESDMADSFSDRLNNQQGALGMPGGMEPEEPKDPEWRIREIYGTNRTLQARLVTTEGKLARIRQGDTLPDGSRVIEVSKTQVKIKKDAEEINLEWVNDAATAEGR